MLHCMPRNIAIIDGHNDTLTRIFVDEGGGVDAFVHGNGQGHLDLPRARQGGLAAGFFAVFIRDEHPDPDHQPVRDDRGGWTLEPPPIDPAWAARETARLLECFESLLDTASDEVRLCRTVHDLETSMRDGRLGIILHIEGCEMISPDLRELPDLYARGLRSLGPVWSRPNAFATGIRFGWPSTNDVGPGLTEAGKDLIRACNAMGILVDLSHLNYQGFMDVADISTAPLVATHCGCHALCASARNLTDAQLRLIADTNGVVGCNFFTGDIRGDGRFDADMPLSRLAEHLEHLVEVMGDEHVALGSDFDGADMCNEMADVAHLPGLIALLRSRGWDESSLTRICHSNWLRVLKQTWQAPS